MINSSEQKIVQDRRLDRAKSTGGAIETVKKKLTAIQPETPSPLSRTATHKSQFHTRTHRNESKALLRLQHEGTNPLLTIESLTGDAENVRPQEVTPVAIRRKANVSKTATGDNLPQSKTPPPSRNEKSTERKEGQPKELLVVPRGKTPTVRREKSRGHKVEVKEGSPLLVEERFDDERKQRSGGYTRTLSMVKMAKRFKTGKPSSLPPSPTVSREETSTSDTSSPTLHGMGETRASPTSSGYASEGRNLRKLKVSFTGVQQPPLTFNPNATPRKMEEAVNLPRSLDLRTEAKEKLLADLAKNTTLLGKQVHDAGKKHGKKESRELRKTLGAAFTGVSAEQIRLLPIVIDADERAAEDLTIDTIVKHMTGVEDQNNPFVDVGNLVCVVVAQELVNRLAQWTDVNRAMEQKIFGQVPLKDESSVAKKWKRKGKLSSEQANVLYMLAQEVGSIVGEKMKEEDRKQNIQRFSSLKNHCKPGSKIAEVIDDFYGRIARKVAIEMAESLVSTMREFPQAMVSAEKKNRSHSQGRAIRRAVKPRRSEQTKPNEEDTITSSANPAFNLQESSDSPADEEKMFTSPPDPVTANPDNVNT